MKIRCNDFIDELGNLLEDDVSPELRSHLEAHLAECKACSVVYDTTQKTITIVTDSESFDLPLGEWKAATGDIMAKIRKNGDPHQ
ncbi:MAG: zf-HC2 domain-containing protein [Bryobacteraceae bacterium]